MIHYQKQYIRIKGEAFKSPASYILQLDSPQLIGIVRSFRNNPKGEDDRRTYLVSANLDLTAKANRHRVFCHPYGSAQKLGNQMTPEEIRRIMAEMADFYIGELSPEQCEKLKDKPIL